MPEEITQRLGFDASRAIEELRKLQDQLNQFKQGLQSTSGVLRKFPGKAAPAIKAFRQLATEAKKAKIAMQGMGQVAAIPATVPASVQNAAQAMNKLSMTTVSAGSTFNQFSAGVNQGTQATTGLGQAVKQSANVTQQAANTTAAAGAKTANALNEAGKAGQDAGHAITLSWKTIIRVVQAQIIVRAVSALVRVFTEAQEAATEFSIRIGEAATIAGGALGSLDAMNKSVLDLSRTLGLARDEVAEGLYQTLSNQVVEAADALRFEAQAAKLSIATYSELKSAVNALSSVMNSYNLNVAETERVADVLFTTIELGRLRLSEFGDVLGRVAPLTEALGIRYEEMAAAIAALTQKGVPAHTAITQLTQVSQKLLRPTEKLNELYREWGVETGPEAIRRFGGLQGVLLKMKDASAGNSKEFADLLGRVRAMVGALNLTSNEGNALTEALDRMENSAGKNEAAFQKVNETVGRDAVRAWNDLDVSVTQLGLSLLEITTPMIEFFNKLTKNFEYVIAAMVAAGGAALVMSGHFTIASISAKGLWASVIGLKAAFMALLPVMILVAAALVTTYAAKALQDSLDQANELAAMHKRQSEDLTKTHEEQTRRRLKATEKEFNKSQALIGEHFSRLTKMYRKDVEAVAISSKVIGQTLSNAISDLTAKRQKALKIVRDAVLDMDDVIKDSMKEVAETQEAIENTSFKRSLRHMNARENLWAKIERAQRSAEEARKAYIFAGANEEAARAARELSHLAEKRAEEAISQAEEMGNYGDLKRAEKELDRVRADRIRGEVEFQIERKKHQSDAHKERLQQLEAEGIKFEELAKIMQEALDPFKEGKLKGPAQMAKDAERIIALMPELEASLKSAFDFSLYEKLDVADSMAKVQTELKKAFDTARIDWGTIAQDLQTTLSAKKYTANVTISIENEYILEQFAEKYGEFNPLGDPGQADDRMREVLKGTVRDYEDAEEKMIQHSANAALKIQQSKDKIADDKWYIGWNRIAKMMREDWESFPDPTYKATFANEAYSKSLHGNLPVTEQLRIKLNTLNEVVKQAALEKRSLTDEEQKAAVATYDYAVAAEEAGELTQNQLGLAVESWKNLNAAVMDTEKAMQAYEKREAISLETKEEAVRILEETRSRIEEAAEAQKAATIEVEKTKNELELAKQVVTALPDATLIANKTLATGVEIARQLKIELQGAAQAQRELSQAPSTLPATFEKPEQVALPEKTEGELEAQTQAARNLTGELANVDRQNVVIFQSASNVTQTMLETSGAAEQIAGNIEQTIQPTNSLHAGFVKVTQQVGSSVDAVKNLTDNTKSATTFTNTASNAAAGWASQLRSCAAAGWAAAEAMRAAAAAALEAAEASSAAAAASSSGGAYYGGPATRYFQGGGFLPRGQDRIPVMVAAGESIISAKNTRRFAAEIQAMNAGSEPSYRDHGGPITNIGDIKVSVTSTQTGSQTGREIATALRRELRRKTSRLN